MDRLAAWLWKHYRGHYAAVLITQTVIWPFLIMVPSVASVVVALGLAWTEVIVLAVVFLVVFGTAGAVAVLVVARPLVGPVARWADGDHGDPAEVRDALDRLYRVPWAFGLGDALPTLLAAGFAGRYLGMSWPVTFTMAFAAVTVVLGSSLLAWATWDAVVRPVQAEIDAALADDLPHTPRRPVGRRLMVLMSMTLLSAAWMGGLFLSGVESDAAQYLASPWVAFPLAAVLAAAGWYLGVSPVVTPVRALVAGTERVAAGVLDERVPVTSDDEFGELARSFNRMQAGLLERARLSAAFGSYVDPALAERLLERGDEMFDGEQLEVTVFFADIRSFTTYAEAHSPEDVVSRLNELFGVMVPILREYGGHANKFLGDGLLAVFGAPQRLEDHADRAVDAAIAIQHKVRRTFGEDVRIGIGINTGPVIAGTVGGGGKLEFTLIGDTVNVAARIEELTKKTGDAILVSGSTLDALQRPVATVARGDHEIRGRSGGVSLHALTAW